MAKREMHPSPVIGELRAGGTRSALSELIRTRMLRLGFSYRYAASPSRVGDLISPQTLHRYADPRTASAPDETTIKGIALAIEVPVSKVEKAVGVPSDLGAFDLPAKAARLTMEERKLILSMIDALLAAHRDSGRAARPQRRTAN